MDLNYILAARQGHIEMLQAIFGKPEEAKKRLRPEPEPVEQIEPIIPAQPDAPPLTAEIFDELFGNAKGRG